MISKASLSDFNDLWTSKSDRAKKKHSRNGAWSTDAVRDDICILKKNHQWWGMISPKYLHFTKIKPFQLGEMQWENDGKEIRKAKKNIWVLSQK